MQEIIAEDIQKFGIIPELIGRLPVFAALEQLTVCLLYTSVQGAKQTGTPVFTPGKTTVNGKEVTVKIDETVKPTFDDGTTEKKVPCLLYTSRCV